jgi:hypothetical protein
MLVRLVYDTGARTLCIFNALNPLFFLSSLSFESTLEVRRSCAADRRSGTPRISAVRKFIPPKGPSCFLRAGFSGDVPTFPAPARLMRFGRLGSLVLSDKARELGHVWINGFCAALNEQSRHVLGFVRSIFIVNPDIVAWGHVVYEFPLCYVWLW